MATNLGRKRKNHNPQPLFLEELNEISQKVIIGLTYFVDVFFHVAWHSSFDCWIRKAAVLSTWELMGKQQANCFDTRRGSKACGMSFKGRSAMNFLTWRNKFYIVPALCLLYIVTGVQLAKHQIKNVCLHVSTYCNHFQHSALPSIAHASSSKIRRTPFGLHAFSN